MTYRKKGLLALLALIYGGIIAFFIYKYFMLLNDLIAVTEASNAQHIKAVVEQAKHLKDQIPYVKDIEERLELYDLNKQKTKKIEDDIRKDNYLIFAACVCLCVISVWFG